MMFQQFQGSKLILISNSEDPDPSSTSREQTELVKVKLTVSKSTKSSGLLFCSLPQDPGVCKVPALAVGVSF